MHVALIMSKLKIVSTVNEHYKICQITISENLIGESWAADINCVVTKTIFWDVDT